MRKPALILKKTIRYFLGALFSIFISFLPSLMYAASGCDPTTGICTASANSAFFTPSANDQSIIYMGELFGSIPPVLAGSGSSLLGNLFKIFNTAIMALGIILAGYTTFVGILNTAGEGEMLGKGWNSIWVPIKTVAGIGLLIPTASGYCVVQIFMAWLLIQGIGAADSLTSGIIDYMESGQAVYVPGNTPSQVLTQKNGQIVSLESKTELKTDWDTTPITKIYQGLSCMQGLQKNYPLVNKAYVTPPSPITSDDKNTITYDFTAYKYKSDPPILKPDGSYESEPISCGIMSLDNSDSNKQAMNDYIVQGLNAIMPSLNSAAYFMVNDTSDSEDTVMGDTFNFVGSDFMNQVALTYNSYVIQASNSQAKASPNDYLDSIRDYGWITIGNLYWEMAKSSDGGGISETAETSAKLNWKDTNNISDAPTSGSIYDISDGTNNTVYEYGNVYGNQFMLDLINSRNNDSGSTHSFSPDKHKDYSNAANGVMSAITLDVFNQMLDSLNSSGTNPMIAAQRLGHKIVYNVEALMTTFVVTELAMTAGFIGLAAGFWTAPFAIALIGAQLMILIIVPFLFILYGTLMTLGSILAVVIPMIPALVFFLAAIAWMVATLETIVAAPIVAVGLIHPDGQHPVWGKAEPAIMLIINMFLRPSLMVIGMAAGVLLSYISVQFVNFGFGQALASLYSSGGKGFTWAEATLFLTTYVGLILACVNKSFSVIDALPDTVMRWISGGEGTRFGGGQEAMQKLQGSQESTGQKTAGDTTSSGQQAGQAGEQTVKKAEDAASRKAANKENQGISSLAKG